MGLIHRALVDSEIAGYKIPKGTQVDIIYIRKCHDGSHINLTELFNYTKNIVYS